jgi:biopolymer transport protein TolQ
MEQIGVFEMIMNAGLMVQFVMLLLLFMSVASWAIILIKYIQIKKAYSESAAFVEYFWKSRNFSDSFARARNLHYSPIARVFRIAYLELKKLGSDPGVNKTTPEKPQITLDESIQGYGNIKRALRRSSNMESIRLIQMVPFLATTGNTAPFVGLFGTVWGIMNSFHSLAYKKGAASVAAVAPGISEALVATAAGLAVAIPAVIAFNYFTYKIRIIESELDIFSSDFLNIVEHDLTVSKEA